ncbi:unnamed protein product [Effrenium voratum]|nr:unnamed protein product [Effrenium voratum]
MQRSSQEANVIGAPDAADDESQDVPMLPQLWGLDPVLETLESKTGRRFCSSRASRIALLFLLVFLVCCGCILSSVLVTVAALSRLYRRPAEMCPGYLRHALCNWGEAFGGSSGPKAALAISEANALWRPKTSAMAGAVARLQELGPRADQDFCDFVEDWMPRLGFNGLIDLVEALEQAESGASEGVWDVSLEDLPQGVLNAAEDWKHDLGSYVVARLQQHPVPHRDMYLEDAVEVAGSLKLGGAPLHAMTWTSMLDFVRSRGNATGLWSFVQDNICFRFQELPELFVHCIHGLGHGAMASAVLLSMDERQRKEFEDLQPCPQLRDGTSDLRMSSQMLKSALDICATAPAKQLGYVCAGGVFMEFWKSRGDEWTPKYDDTFSAPVRIQEAWLAPQAPPDGTQDDDWRFEHTCAFAAFPATCFRFEPGLGAEGQKERFKGLEDVSVEEPCTQSAWSSQVVWGRKQLRGCILGRAFNLYMDFDTWRHGTFAQHTGKTSRQRLNTLREWCSMYEPPGAMAPINSSFPFQLKRPVLPLVRSYGNWLACIAGCMANVAFIVENDAVEDSVVEDHCQQIEDQRGRRLCVEIGLSRHLRNASEMHIWPTDILENDQVLPD